MFSYVFFANFQPTGQIPAIGWTPGTSPGWTIQMWAFPADFRLFNVVYHKISCLFVFLNMFLLRFWASFRTYFRLLFVNFLESIKKSNNSKNLRFYRFLIYIFWFCINVFIYFLIIFFIFFAVEVCRSNWRKNQLETKLTKNINWKPNRRKNWKPNLRSNWRKLNR